MTTEISQIRFFCKRHSCVLENCGSGRVINPTHTVHETNDYDRRDQHGWLYLDSSELYCPHDTSPDGQCQNDWVVQAK